MSGNATVPTNQEFTFEDNISVRNDRRYRAVFNAAKVKNKRSVPGNEEDTFDIFESLTSFFKDISETKYKNLKLCSKGF